MTILYAGTTIDQMVITGDVRETAQTSDAYCDIRFTSTDGSGNYADTPDLGVNLRDHWYTFRHVNDLATTTTGRRNTAWELVDASGVGVVRIHRPGAVNDRFQRWNGSAWVDVGTGVGAVVNFADAHCAVYAKLAVSGELSLYVDGVLKFTETGDFSAYASPRAMRHGRYQAGNNSGTMECVIADESLIGVRFSYDVPDSNGANTAWTGDYTNVDETVIDTTDVITSASAGDRETVKTASRSTKINGKVVKAVVLNHMSAKGTTGPTKICTHIRKSSTDYDFATDQTMTFGFKGWQQLWTTDPSTGVAWTPTDAGDANLEFGVKSVT